MTETASSSALRGVGASLRDAWRLARPYFAGSDARIAWLLLIGTLLLNLASVGLSVVFNYWYGALQNALQEYDLPSFVALMFTYHWDGDLLLPGFLALGAATVGIGVLAVFTQQRLEIRWRTWLTERMLGAYLGDRLYYRIAIAARGDPISTDNPDQRISEDIHAYVKDSLTLGFDFISNVVSLVSFVAILWGLSGAITVFGVTVPGYMVFLAVGYALIGTVVAHFVGRPLAAITFSRQRVEADFRFGLVRLRENAENVALLGGEPEERRMLSGRFDRIVDNFLTLLRRILFINAYGSGFQQIAVIFPFIIAAPRYFAKAIPLGGLFRVVDGFAQVNKSLTWIVTNYTDLATYRANIDRLGRFDAAMTEARAAQVGAIFADSPGADFVLQDVTIRLPDGRVLFDGALRFAAGEPVVIAGRSGTGKSTLLRTLAGIWPFASGRILRPAGRLLFLPQRAYLPLGTLRHAVCYPREPASFDPDAVRDALEALGLGRLVPELDTEQPDAGGWQSRLSGGEQQRLALARALLARPDWLFLDEATASLDPAGEAEVYDLLRARLPHTTLVSIAHRPAVAGARDRRLVLDGATGSLQAAAITASTAGP